MATSSNNVVLAPVISDQHHLAVPVPPPISPTTRKKIEAAKAGGLGPHDRQKVLGKRLTKHETVEDPSVNTFGMEAILDKANRKVTELDIQLSSLQVIQSGYKKIAKNGTRAACAWALVALVVAAVVAYKVFGNGEVFSSQNTFRIILGIVGGYVIFGGGGSACIVKVSGRKAKKGKKDIKAVTDRKLRFESFKDPVFLELAHKEYLRKTEKSLGSFPPHLETFMDSQELIDKIKEQMEKARKAKAITATPTVVPSKKSLIIPPPSLHNALSRSRSSAAQETWKDWPINVPEQA